jgi:hypothetical protein
MLPIPVHLKVHIAWYQGSFIYNTKTSQSNEMPFTKDKTVRAHTRTKTENTSNYCF